MWLFCQRVRVGAVGLFGMAVLGPSAGQSQQRAIQGTVVDSAGAPIQNADVGVVALRQLTRTDEKGHFALTKLPIEEFELSVRRLGYEPRSMRIAATVPSASALRVVLTAQPVVLSALHVNSAEMRKREMIEDFYRRRSRGIGQYITREQMEARWGGAPSDMLRTTPGIRLIRSRAGGYGVRFPNTSLSRFDCAPMIWIDGQRAPGLEIDEIPLRDVEGIELYNGPATTPLQFSQTQSANSCGTIVVWSRPPLHQSYQRKP